MSTSSTNRTLLQALESIQEEIEDEFEEIDFENLRFEDEDDYYDDSMDGDHESGLRDAGFGTDEDYGFFGGDEY